MAQTPPAPAFPYLSEAPNVDPLDLVWLMLGAILIFFMQTGFGMLEAGMVRSKNVTNILFKNVLDVAISGLVFWAFGWGFAFGGDSIADAKRNGFIGGCEFFLDSCGGFPIEKYGLWFFHWAFSATASTIISGAVAERVNVFTYLFFSAVVSGFVYPVIVHWCWSGAGWLSPFADSKEFNRVGDNGFLDFAGSGVVHLVGGTAALVGALVVGPRVGRFPARGHYETREQSMARAIEFAPHNKSLAVLGVFILWFGWYGFNAGSTLGASGNGALVAGKVVVTTTLSAAGSCLTGVFVKWVADKRRWLDLDTALNATLAGLVSITAGCAFVDPWAAFVIGIIGAVVFLGASWLMEKLRIDDPLQATPIHCFCGMWGCVAVGLFATEGNIARALGRPIEKYGLFMGGGVEQWGIQMLAVVVIFTWSAFWAAFIFVPLRVFGLLRVSDVQEEIGLDLSEHHASAYDTAHLVEKMMREQQGYHPELQYWDEQQQQQQVQQQQRVTPPPMYGEQRAVSPPALMENPAATAYPYEAHHPPVEMQPVGFGAAPVSAGYGPTANQFVGQGLYSTSPPPLF